MIKYGVAFSSGWHNMRHHKHAYPQVITCDSEEDAIETAKRIRGDAVPFELSETITEVDWNYVEEHEIHMPEFSKFESLPEQLKELSCLSVLNDKTKSLISGAANRIVVLEKANEKLKEEKIDAVQAQIPLLKAMIGRPIYWVNPNWKMETHTITGVRFEESYGSDFFDSDDEIYKGTPQVVIEIDGDEECRGGDYLASRLGIDLFFDEEEALQHSKYANIPLQK